MISNATKRRWDYYSAIEGAKYLGQEEGEALGAHENAVKVAIKLKNKGVPLEEIQEITELSIAEIKKNYKC